MADEKMIITIGREHGTMGDRVAEKIRRQFELPLYDKAHPVSYTHLTLPTIRLV